MNLYIVRHGESTWNNQNRIQGNSDPELSALGRVQAGLLAKRFKGIKIDRIYSSPLSRSMQTARIISKALRREIIKKKELKEICLGEWEGKTTDEVDKLYGDGYQRWLKAGPTKIRIPGAENIRFFQNRAQKAFRDIVKENQDNDLLVVTHGGVIAAFLADLLDADFDRLILGLRIPNTCVTLVSFYPRANMKGCLVHVADTLHLSKGYGPAR